VVVVVDVTAVAAVGVAIAVTDLASKFSNIQGPAKNRSLII
jgi:hypothetical protein